LATLLAGFAYAQTPITFQYVYDETGQLIKAIDSTGTVIEYVYDEVGNFFARVGYAEGRSASSYTL